MTFFLSLIKNSFIYFLSKIGKTSQVDDLNVCYIEKQKDFNLLKQVAQILYDDVYEINWDEKLHRTIVRSNSMSNDVQFDDIPIYDIINYLFSQNDEIIDVYHESSDEYAIYLNVSRAPLCQFTLKNA